MCAEEGGVHFQLSLYFSDAHAFFLTCPEAVRVYRFSVTPPPPSKVVDFTYADRQNSRGRIATACKCAAARTHSTPTQLKLHLRWKVTGPVHCLGNGRRCWWREQHCSVMMLSEKRVSSGQTPARLLSIH